LPRPGEGPAPGARSSEKEVRLAAAYGDTAGDHDMLKLADERGYRVFTAKA